MIPEEPVAEVAGKYALSSSYLRGKRVFSYAHQLAAVIELRPRRVLEIGKGPGLVAAALRAVGIDVVTLDAQAGLKPDVVGSVTAIPLQSGAVDMVLCCQVLEHLPWEQFEVACRQLHRVAREAMVLSLPDLTRHYFVHLRLPFLKKLQWSGSIGHWRRRGPKTGPLVSGHYWEIGFRGVSARRIRAVLKRSGWTVERTWRVPENVWHRFFVCRKAGFS